MTWTSITQAEMEMARHVVTYIRVAREAGYGGPDWLPSDADLSKSALLERLRSGKEPLDEPPPLGLSCPWYALVEDRGPHYVFGVWRGGPEHPFMSEDTMVVLQYAYKIIEQGGKQDFLLRDGRRDTSYRFRLFFDSTWKHPGAPIVGGWFMYNHALALSDR